MSMTGQGGGRRWRNDMLKVNTPEQNLLIIIITTHISFDVFGFYLETGNRRVRNKGRYEVRHYYYLGIGDARRCLG